MMEKSEPYRASDKLRALIADNAQLLMALSRFGIPLGFGDKTVEEVCSHRGIDTRTFLSVANFMGGRHVDDTGVQPGDLMKYLIKAHDYFLNFQLPMIRRKLIEAVDISDPEELGLLILRFFDDFAAEVRRHMEVENRKVFPYVQALLEGRDGTGDRFRIVDFSRNHEAIAPKMKELKDIIVRYYPGAGSDMLNSALFDIITCETDLTLHCEVEDKLFVPVVKRYEEELARKANSVRETSGVKKTDDAPADTTDAEKIEALSEREKEIIVNIAKGLSNKEIADRLCLSVHTVTTHRRNISQKLSIHTPAGLTIFAIVNHLIPPGEIPRPR